MTRERGPLRAPDKLRFAASYKSYAYLGSDQAGVLIFTDPCRQAWQKGFATIGLHSREDRRNLAINSRAIKMRRGNASPSSAQNLRAREREVRCLELHKAGASYEQIASAVGYKCASSAWRAVARALARIPAPAAEELRKIDSERCERLLFSLRGGIDRGEPRAVEAAIRVLSHRARLNGYLAPERHEVSGRDGGPIEAHVDNPLWTDPEVLRAIREAHYRQHKRENGTEL
jgi:hypothetical protein